MRMRLTAAILVIGAATAFADKKFDDAVAKADEQLRKGKQEDALKTVEKLVDQNPGPEALLVLSRLHDRLGDLDAAGQALDSALAAASGEQRAAVLAARSAFDLRVSSGQVALGHAEEAVELAENADTLAARARARVRVGDYPAAQADAEKALKMDPQNRTGQIALGEALMGLGRPADAVEVLQKAVSSAPSTGCALCRRSLLNLARTRLALALIASGRASEAVTVARQATEANEKAGEAFAVLGTAILADNKASWSDAIAQAQMGAFNNPKNPLVNVLVARIFEAGGNPAQAERHYRMALEADPAYAPAQVALIQALVANGKLDDALDLAKKLVEKAPQSGEAQLMLGTILIRKGQWADATVPLEQAARYSPGNSLAHAALGTDYQYVGESTKAAEEYRQAVKLDPKNVDYQVTFGLLLGLSGKYEEGIEVLKKITSTPGYKDTAGFTNLGWIYRSMDPRRPAESAAAYKKALELDPKNYQAAIGLGWALSYAKDFPAAIAAFNKAIQIEPKTAGEAYNGIAWCYYFSKEMDKAEEFSNKAQQAGRNVNGLVDAIAKYREALKKGIAEAKEAQERAQREWEEANQAAKLLDQVKKGPVESRIDAIRKLGKLGSDEAVQALTWVLRDTDRELQLESCQALAKMGSVARAAVPMLRHLVETQTEWPTIMDEEQMKQQWLEGQVKRCAQDALTKIR
jgi:tetratricopeptide (TPR) repeat protein